MVVLLIKLEVMMVKLSSKTVSCNPTDMMRIVFPSRTFCAPSAEMKCLSQFYSLLFLFSVVHFFFFSISRLQILQFHKSSADVSIILTDEPSYCAV